MPSQDPCYPSSSKISLENSCLRGGKSLSQPRFKLALNLPGSEWLNPSPLCQPNTDAFRPQNLSLVPSWEKKSRDPPKLSTTSILTTKYSLTPNPILDSQSSLTYSQSLKSNLSLATSVTDFSSTIITSKPTLMSCNSIVNSSLTTNLSLPSNIALTSKPSPRSNLADIDCHLTSEHVSTIVKAQSTVTCLTESQNNFDSSKLGKTLPSDGSSDQETTLGVTESESRALVTQDTPSLTFEIMPPKQTQHASVVSLSKTTQQPVNQESTTFNGQQLKRILHQKKMALVSAACCSLVNGPKYSDSTDPTRTYIWDLCEEMAKLDPEFVLKVALYTRQELNIRSTANFLLALSARIPACRPHLRRYFCASTQLPSDWMEVPRLYQSLVGTSERLVPLPSCLCKSLTIKFKEFSEYQLAKYNTRRQRGKHGPKRKGNQNVNVQRQVKVGKSLRCLKSSLESIQERFDAPPPPRCKKTKDSFSLKTLIRRLHISKPANHVMSLLGCKYPKDMQSFSHSGLEGPWQPQLAGCRMKLKQPETWERELSQQGNTGPVWEKLLDNHQVPFMALLRNLRNLIRAGVSKRHHKQVADRLSNKNAVIKSRLFPFRFLSAYKVIGILEIQRVRAEGPFPSNMTLLRRILKREGKSDPKLHRHRFVRRQLRACLAVPAIYQLLKREKETLKKARSIKLDQDVLQSYKNALEEATQISASHNIPPLPGRTVILFSVCSEMYNPCPGAKDLRVSTEDSCFGSVNNSPNLLEIGLLLALMVKSTSESTQLVLYNDHGFLLVDTPSGSILQNLSTIKDQAGRIPVDSSLPFDTTNPKVDYILELLRKRTKVDTLMVFGPTPLEQEFHSVMKHYRRAVNANCLCVSVLPAGFRSEDNPDECNDVTLCGFSEQVLRYVSERGTARLLDHVEKVNERFSVPEDTEIAKRRTMVPEIITSFPKQRWRSVRIFISSTFRDMHSERDLLISRVMPELRVRAAQHFLSLEEVDLRWGITEEEAKKDRQLSLCLSEVSRSQIFIGFLGERYGHIPTSYSVPLLPKFQWIQTYPPGRSITELEAIQFVQSCDSNVTNCPKAFIYLRTPDMQQSTANPWLSDFIAETRAAEICVADLKNSLCVHPAVRSYRYTFQFGERDGKPFVTGLENLEARLVEDIWQAIERDFISEDSDQSGEDEEQEGYQEWQEWQFCARNKLVLSTCASILSKTGSSSSKGQMFLVCSEPSQGKTVFMAKLVKELRCVASSSVISHFTGVSPEARGVEHMLTRVCRQLCLYLQREHDNTTSYRALKEQFQYLLLVTSQSLKRSETLTLLIDGADLLLGRAGELSSDWIPEHLPPRVNLVLSMTAGSSLCGSLRRQKDSVMISLGDLEPSDQVKLVRQRLAVYGKKLDESAFNNQMRLLLIKRGTRDPLYLTMACEELRTKAVFEKLSDDIQTLPTSFAPLMQKRLKSLEDEHGATMVTIALTAICLSRKGLQERDLLRILSTSKRFCSLYTASWSQVLAGASQAQNLPMTTFSLMLRALRSVLGLWTFDARLHLPSGLIRDAVEKRYLAKQEVIQTVHLLLAAHFWTVCFPDFESFHDPPAECLTELTHHLLCSQQLQTLSDLLLSLPFLKTHATLGILPHLCQVFSRYAEVVSKMKSSSENLKECTDHQRDQLVEELREFIQRHLPILSQTPSIFYQLALNEPRKSAVCIHAQKMVCTKTGSDGQLLLICSNKPQHVNVCTSKALKVLSTPTCVVFGSEGKHFVVGMSDGSLQFINTDTGEDLRILQSSCDGVSACELIGTDLLCVASYDGIIEIWNIRDGCRIHRTEAHRRQVTGCCVTTDCKQLLTCSLDSQLKLWEIKRGTLLSSTYFPSPINCAELHPQRPVIAVGTWDGKITVLRLDNWKRSAILGGGSSVRAVTFSSDSNIVISGSLDGCVSFWDWEAHVQLAHFSAHNGSTVITTLVGQQEYVVTGGEDGKVLVWLRGRWQYHGLFWRESFQSSALCLAISPDLHSLAIGYHSDGVCVYDLNSGNFVSSCTCSEDVAVSALVWLSDSLLASASANLVKIWNIKPVVSHCQLVLHEHHNPVQALAASSKLLASASEDVSVCLWTLESLLLAESPPNPVCVPRGHTAAVTCCAFSKDGNLLATGGKDRNLLCWDVSINPPGLAYSLLSCHRDWVSGCTWTDDNKLISCSVDGSVCLWDISKQELLLQFAGHLSAVISVLYMKDRVLTAGRDGYLKIWTLSGLEVFSIPTRHNELNQVVAYWNSGESQGDEDLMVCAAGSLSHVFHWRLLKMVKFQTLCGHGGAVMTSATAPQCDSIITAALDGSVRVWEKAVRDEQSVLYSHNGAVTAIAWSPDGELMVSGGETGDMKVWTRHQAIVNFQCSELCISSIIFTTRRSFCVISNDLKVSRWLLLPCKGGLLRAKNAYSVETESLVVKATLISAQQLELITVTGNRFIIEPKTGSLKHDDSGSSSMPEPRALPPPEQLPPGDINDALESDIGVCDTDGSLWLSTSNVKRSNGKAAVKWKRIQLHDDSISCLCERDDYVVSASADRSVKIWDRNSFRQMGLFHCEGAVTCLSLSPKLSSDEADVMQIACGDHYGRVYILTACALQFTTNA